MFLIFIFKPQFSLVISQFAVALYVWTTCRCQTSYSWRDSFALKVASPVALDWLLSKHQNQASVSPYSAWDCGCVLLHSVLLCGFWSLNSCPCACKHFTSLQPYNHHSYIHFKTWNLTYSIFFLETCNNQFNDFSLVVSDSMSDILGGVTIEILQYRFFFNHSEIHL